MTPSELQWLKGTFAAMGKANVDRMAECHVFVEIIGDLICETTGREDVVSVRAEIRERLRQKQEEYLLKIDEMNPGLAALMDKDRPLLPPNDQPTP